MGLYKNNLKKSLEFLILRGYGIQDIFWVNLAKLNFLLYKFLNRETSLGHYLLKGSIVKNSYGVFFCRKRSSDLSSIIESREFEEMEKVKKLVGAGDVVIDCGAHIGKYTIFASKNVSDGGKVIAFEPHPDNYEILIKNLRLNKCRNVVALKVGLWNKNGTHAFSISSNYAQHSMVIDHRKNYLKIKVNKLDAILNRFGIKTVKLLKLDAEGAEYFVLLGALKSLRAHRISNIVLETHPIQLERNGKIILIRKSKELLKSCGYTIQRLSREHIFCTIRKSDIGS